MDRLETFEKALKDILDEYDKLGKELEILRNNDKTKKPTVLVSRTINCRDFNLGLYETRLSVSSHYRLHISNFCPADCFNLSILHDQSDISPVNEDSLRQMADEARHCQHVNRFRAVIADYR